MILFLKLVLAHLLGDFIFQSDKWVKEKELKKHKSPKLYLHALLHGLLSMALVAETSFWTYAIVITLTHFFIDWGKSEFQNNDTRKTWFFADQVIHLSILVAISLIRTKDGIDFSAVNEEKWIMLSTALVFLTIPTSVLVKMLISGW